MNNRVLFGSLAILLVILVAGALLFVNNSNKAVNQTAVTPTPSVTNATQTPTPEAKASPSGVMQEETQTVILTSSGFSPATVTIKAGGKVVWKNQSGEVATVNSAPHPIHTNYPPLNLGSFQDGETLELIFSKAGTYGYHNHLNSSQKGTVIVK